MENLSDVDYGLLCRQAEALVDGESNLVANLSNISALIQANVSQLNWAGFYLRDSDNDLVLGPFQGNPACVRIPVGRGVCGTAVSTATTQRVADVHAFAGHIACDAASNSELVVPIFNNGRVVAVLDLDSPEHDRFSAADQAGFELLVQSVIARLFQAS